MSTLRSYLVGSWCEGSGAGTPLVDPTTGTQIGTASSKGLDLGAALAHARTVGGPALRAMTFAERGAMLEGLSAVLHANRDALLDVSRQSGGTTRGDGKFDVDGASGTLAWYAQLGKTLGDRRVLPDGDPDNLLRSKRFVGQHVFVPRHGVAIHINAFNFPAWGMAEKAAMAWLAGMPVFTKPGSATAALAERIATLWVETGLLPNGAFSLLCGSAGDLLDHVDPQDCIAFTGGSETAARIRGHSRVVAKNVRVNLEADSLNASILGPDVAVDSDTFLMFIGDVSRDMLQKAGQKCTAVRRIFVPNHLEKAVVEALTDRLERSTVGDPKDHDVGPLASPAQRKTVAEGMAALDAACTVAWRGQAPEGGAFVTPTLYRTDRFIDATHVHDHEVFGPVATLLPWSGDANEVVSAAARGGGGLVASVYSDDEDWSAIVVLGLLPWHGRVHWGSKKVHDQSPGPGTVLPNLVHGGPGRAGGGEELGGLRGLQFYSQRTAIQGDRALIERLLQR